MKHTVFENKKTKARFFSNYCEKDDTGWYNIIGHCDTIEDAQAMCSIARTANINSFLDRLPKELRSDKIDNFIKNMI